MSESIEIGFFDEYEGCNLVCRVNVFNGVNKVKSWSVENPDNLIAMAVEAGHESNVFEGVRMKKMLAKAIELFEPNKITMKEK